MSSDYKYDMQMIAEEMAQERYETRFKTAERNSRRAGEFCVRLWEAVMFGFGKAKEKKPKEPRKQGFITQNDKWVEYGPDEPFIYEGLSWGLVRKGTVWPPVIQDSGHSDRTELFQAIAEGLNNLGANRAILKKLRETAKKYQATEISATEVADIVVRIVNAAKNIQVG